MLKGFNMVFKDVSDDELFSFIVGWAETNNAHYDTRVINGRIQVGMLPHYWRRAEYQGAV